MKKTLYIYLLIASCISAAAQNRFTSDQPFHSEKLSQDLPYAVVLPADYDANPDTRYPVVYLTHGIGCTPDDWNDKYIQFENTLVQLEKEGLGDMIYIFPTGFNSYYSNTYDGRYPYMDMFIQEFIPHIEKKYKVRAEKGFRSIGGLSMGGYGSLLYAIKYPDLFSVCIAMSAGVMTDQELLDRFNGNGSSYGLMELYGCTKKRLSDHWYANSILELVKNMPENQRKQVKFYIDCGDDDFLYRGNSELHILMREKGITHEYRVRDGAHNWTYWRSALEAGLKYISQSQRY